MSADPKDASNLLQRAGFTLLTVDLEDIAFGYPSMYELVEDLRDMGEGNAIIGRRTFLKRDTLVAAASIYEGQLHSHRETRIMLLLTLMPLSSPRQRGRLDPRNLRGHFPGATSYAPSFLSATDMLTSDVCTFRWDGNPGPKSPSLSRGDPVLRASRTCFRQVIGEGERRVSIQIIWALTIYHNRSAKKQRVYWRYFACSAGKRVW